MILGIPFKGRKDERENHVTVMRNEIEDVLVVPQQVNSFGHLVMGAI